MTSIRCVLLLVALVTSNASLASAQVRNYCDASQFNALTNMWKVQADENTSQVPAGDLPAERKIMRRVLEMFQTAFVPTGAAGLVGVNYDTLPQELKKSRYGNTYTFTLSHHKIECINDNKPVPMDVSYGNVSVQVNAQFVEEAEDGDSYVGFSYLPRGYYQLKEGISLPQGKAEGIQEWNFRDGTTVWWLTRGTALPFRFVTRREFLTKQIEIVQAKKRSAGLLAYYQRLLGDATDDVAFVKEAQVPGLTEKGYVFTTLEDRANRIYVTVNPAYYDRSLPKSTPQQILIRLKHADERFLNHLGNGPRHLESFQKLREIVRANLPELRSMVK